MNPNKLLSIIVILCILPLIVMTANSGVEVVDNLKPIKNTDVTLLTKNQKLEVGNTYFDIKTSLPKYQVFKEINQPVVIISEHLIIELDEIATSNTTKYTISNNSKITKIKPVK